MDRPTLLALLLIGGPLIVWWEIRSLRKKLRTLGDPRDGWALVWALKSATAGVIATIVGRLLLTRSASGYELPSRNGRHLGLWGHLDVLHGFVVFARPPRVGLEVVKPHRLVRNPNRTIRDHWNRTPNYRSTARCAGPCSCGIREPHHIQFARIPLPKSARLARDCEARFRADLLFVLRVPDLATRHGELIEEVRPQKGHSLFTLFAIPEGIHVCLGLP